MSYKEQFERAKTSELVETLIPKKLDFDSVGDVLYGLYKGSRESVSTEERKAFRMHDFKTDDGLVTITGGVTLDAIFNDPDLQGKVVKVEFLGKEKLPGGRSFKKFDVEVIRSGE